MYTIIKFKNITELNQFKRTEIKTVIDIELPNEFDTYVDVTSYMEFNLKSEYLPRKEFAKVYFTLKNYNAVWYDGIYFYSVVMN